jgi:hypothetical protein
MILGLIKITLWNRLTHLLKYFRFNKNEKKMNHNHLKTSIFYFIVTVQKLETFQTDLTLKHFKFFSFGTVPNDSSLNQKCFLKKLAEALPFNKRET